MRFIFLLCISSLFADVCEIQKKPFLERFEEYAESSRKKWNVPGMAIAIVKDGGLVYAKGFGVRDHCTEEAVTPHTIFQAGSITKSFTAALIAMMVDEERFCWTSPVIDYLPDFMMHDPWVTRNFFIEDLLAQKTGLPKKAGDMQVLLGFCPDELLYNLRFIPPVSSFRTEYSYQTLTYLAAGNLLEKLSGESYESLLHNRVFLPLDMKEASISCKAYFASQNRSSFYNWHQGKVRKLPDTFPLINACYVYGPGGGINANVLDLTQWMKLQIGLGTFQDKELISPKNLQKTQQPQIYMRKIGKRDSYYGLGWTITNYSPYSYIWHNGETCGTKSAMAFIPEEKLGIVILTNARGSKLPESLIWQFFDLYYDKKSEDWTSYFLTEAMQEHVAPEKPPEYPYPPLPLQNYIGLFHNEIYGDAYVRMEGDQMTLTIGPKKLRMFLKPWDRDVFTLNWPEFPEAKSKVYFQLDADAEAQKMVIELLYQESGAVFEKVNEEKIFFFGLL